MTKETGGPAFPRPGYINREYRTDSFDNRPEEGMTLRDWFAGQALIALPNIGCGADLDTQETAIAAYQIADAMLKARGE